MSNHASAPTAGAYEKMQMARRLAETVATFCCGVFFGAAVHIFKKLLEEKTYE